MCASFNHRADCNFAKALIQKRCDRDKRSNALSLILYYYCREIEFSRFDKLSTVTQKK